jgi:ribulose-5-phosphate 4-epimerase/fuculose-1-phosphate aldolase
VLTFIASGKPYGSIYHLDGTFYDGIPLFTDVPPESGNLINTMGIADNLTATLGNKRGVFIRNHGVVIVGESVYRVVFSSITLRDNIKMLLPVYAIGAEPVYNDRVSMEHSTYMHYCGSPAARCWNYWNMQAKREFPDIADLEH